MFQRVYSNCRFGLLRSNGNAKKKTRYTTGHLVARARALRGCVGCCASDSMTRDAPADDLDEHRGTISTSRSSSIIFLPFLLPFIGPLPPPRAFLTHFVRPSSVHSRPSPKAFVVHEDYRGRLYKTATVTSARDILSHASRGSGSADRT